MLGWHILLSLACLVLGAEDPDINVIEENIKCDLCVKVMQYYRAKAQKVDDDCVLYKKGTSCNTQARVGDTAVRTLFDRMCGAKSNQLTIPVFAHGLGALTINEDKGKYVVETDPTSREGTNHYNWKTRALKEICWKTLSNKEWDMAATIIRAIRRGESDEAFVESARMTCEGKVNACSPESQVE
eukprot:PhF_6_TR38297/c0_g1_i1/m.57133